MQDIIFTPDETINIALVMAIIIFSVMMIGYL